MAEQQKRGRGRPRKGEFVVPSRGRTATTPLSPAEQRFLTEYIKTSNLKEAVIQAGYKPTGKQTYSNIGRRILGRPNVQAELERVMDELRKETVATAEEVMAYFTAVMRGELNDQFGLDAPLAERTRAAQELAKRTIDVENRAKGNADVNVAIKLDWNREED